VRQVPLVLRCAGATRAACDSRAAFKDIPLQEVQHQCERQAAKAGTVRDLMDVV